MGYIVRGNYKIKHFASERDKCKKPAVSVLGKFAADSLITRDDSKNPAIGRLITSAMLTRASGRKYHMSDYRYVL